MTPHSSSSSRSNVSKRDSDPSGDPPGQIEHPEVRPARFPYGDESFVLEPGSIDSVVAHLGRLAGSNDRFGARSRSSSPVTKRRAITHRNDPQVPLGVNPFPALLSSQPKLELELNEEHSDADRKDPASGE